MVLMGWGLARTVLAVAALAYVLGASQGAAASASVSIADFTFSPSGVTINVGESVTWRNDDAGAHTTTADGGAWDSGGLAPGATFQHTFNGPGTFTYHCSFHPFMTGSVTVRAPAAPTNTPTPRPPTATPAPPTATPTPAPPTATPTPGVPVGPPAAGFIRSYGPIAPSNGQP